MKIVVLKSPWKNLPAGTEIVPTMPREQTRRRGAWFTRKDGKLVNQDEPDGKFMLFRDEFKVIQNDDD